MKKLQYLPKCFTPTRRLSCTEMKWQAYTLIKLIFLFCPKLATKIFWLLIQTPDPGMFEAAEALVGVAGAGCSPACWSKPGTHG